MNQFLKSTLFLLLFCFTCCLHAYSQDLVRNVKANQEGKQITITYDLLGDAKERFEVKLFYGDAQNQTTPLAKVATGSMLGQNVTPGNSRKITIDDLNLFTTLEGDVYYFRVEAIHMPLQLNTSLYKKRLKGGGTVNLQWQGGKAKDFVTLALYKNGQEIDQVSGLQNNVQRYNYTLPKGNAGTFELKLIAQSQGNTPLSTGTFEIKAKKKPILLYILGGLAVVGGIIVGASSGGGDSGGTGTSTGGTTANPKLPLPPVSPGG